MKKIFWIPFIVFSCMVWLCNCNNNDLEKIRNKNIREGNHLAQIHCVSCHQYPDPSLLDKLTWGNYVLPKMGELAGFRDLGFYRYVENGKERTMDLEEWNKIVQYYLAQSPGELNKREETNIRIGLNQFNVQIPALNIMHPATTLVNTKFSDHGFFFGDGQTEQVYFVHNNYPAVDSFPAAKGVSNLHDNDTTLQLLTMGVLRPSDSKEGKLLSVNKFSKKTVVLLDSLQRPVHATYADLNNDHLEDIVISEFGDNMGQLAWYENKGGNKYASHILRPLPGAIKTEIYDFNNDGLPDLAAMMAQGDESVFIYYNLGNGIFKETRILQLPPSYGSNYFELVDFNKDGHPDIIATNGDNGDYPPVLKPYHGIRIYLNDGNNNFKEEIFLPMNGVGKANAKDFDGDGDIDIASISFFPDYNNNPEEGFIYWVNTGGLSFEPSSFSDVTAGRWLTMDAGDIDSDGDIDVVLGNAALSIGAVPDLLKKKWNKYSPPVLVLKNTLH